MIDIRLIRERPDWVKAEIAKLNVEAPIDEIVDLDQQRRQALEPGRGTQGRAQPGEQVDGPAARAHQQGSRLRKRRALEAEFEATRQQMGEVNDADQGARRQLREIDAQLEAAMLQVPNLPDPSVPVGAGRERERRRQPRTRCRNSTLSRCRTGTWGPMLDIIDFERGIKLAGTRFYVLKGLGALLQRALIAWMLDLHVTEHGYTEIYPPFVVQEKCLVGAGQLPKFADNLYHDVEDDFWWVPTGEVPVTNLHREEILDPGTLPLYYVAYTPCWRREKDERRARRARHQARAPVRQGRDVQVCRARDLDGRADALDRQRRGGLPQAGLAPSRRANVHRRPELYRRGQSTTSRSGPRAAASGSKSALARTTRSSRRAGPRSAIARNRARGLNSCTR